MASNEILDDFPKGHKPRLTPFQRWVRITSFVAWVTFLAGVFLDSWPAHNGPLTLIALIVLSILYLFLPIPLFRSNGINQHLVAHWVGAMMLGFLLGLYFKYQMRYFASTFSLVAGLGSLVGVFGLIFFMIKMNMSRDERRFWVSMLVRLAIVVFLTSGATVRFVQRYLG